LVIGADVAAATREGALLNTAARITRGDHGFLPLVTITGSGLTISAVKLAADRSDDVVVRVYESLGRRSAGTLRFDAPHAGVVTTNLLEEPLDGAQCDVDEAGAVGLALSAFEVRTLRFTISRHDEVHP
jgi:alpha-mannosidase